MLKLIDLTYFAEFKFKSLRELSERYRSTLGYADFIKNRIDLTIIKHLNRTEKTVINGIKFLAFTSKNVFGFIPMETHSAIKKMQPDVMLIQGFDFPLQVMILRILLGSKPKIILQYHGGKPGKIHKRVLQRLADNFVDAYLFTGKEMAEEWIEKGVIASKDKCFELPEGSTDFINRDKTACKIKLGFEGDYNFLWVGRLNKNKDPITVLNGFQKYLLVNPFAKLYMIYQTFDLLHDVEEKISTNESLKNAVKLFGKIPHNELEIWYNAADFYISGSHHEGSGFALFESMACGCIPVVTHIAPFKKMLAGGKFGFMFENGNADDLFHTMKKLENIDREKLSEEIAAHFQETMSHKAIADKLYEIINRLIK